jgi:hypothetical protein
VDVCSGVESAPGMKNHRALEQFISAVRAAEFSVRATSAHKAPPNVILIPRSREKDLGSFSK